MDDFTKDRIERAEYILDSLSIISCILTNGYKGITPDREVKYDIPAFTLRENATNTISGAISLIGELIESWKKETEHKKTESHAMDILERLQDECPARYISLSSIEVTPSSEKLTFWLPDNDVFKDPKPDVLASKKTNPDFVSGFNTLNRIIDGFDSYENVRLENGFDGLDGIYLKYDNKNSGCSYAFQFGEFIKGLQGKEDTKDAD